jgi:hypothetical protein
LQFPDVRFNQAAPNGARIEAAIRQIKIQLISIIHIVQFHIR